MSIFAPVIFIFLILLFFFLMGLSVLLGGILNLWYGFVRRFFGGSPTATMNRGKGQRQGFSRESNQEQSQRNDDKIFSADEGIYVDFEEVK